MTHIPVSRTGRMNSMEQMLATGRTLRIPAYRLLARLETDASGRKTVKVSAPEYTLRLSRERFLDLYGNGEALFCEEKAGIDVKKDDDYYAWRRKNQ